MGEAHISALSEGATKARYYAPMAIYHCNIGNVSRGGGSSSCATYAYISGEKVYDERRQENFDYARKERIVETNTILPPTAPPEFADPKVMFNSIEKHLEADNARTAKKFEMALPNELHLDEQKKIVEDFIQANLTAHGYAATYAIHENQKNPNTHVHILAANRPINEKGEWSEGQTKTAFANDRDDNGKAIYNPEKPCYDPKNKEETEQYRIPKIDKNGEQKFRERKGKGKEMLWERVNIEENKLDSRDFLQDLRKNWALEVNKYLAPEHQIDHRSNKERGIEAEPQIHEGYAARQMEKRGIESDRCQINRDIKEQNEVKKELAQKQAELEKLNQREKDLHERMGRINGRRKDDESLGRTPERERRIEESTTTDRGFSADNSRAGADNQRTKTTNFISGIVANRRSETQRRFDELSRKREEDKRAKQIALERQRKLAERNRAVKGKSRAENEYSKSTNSNTQTTDRGYSR